MRGEGRRALSEGWPVLLTAVVIGIAFGIAAREGGLTALEASGMSVLIFAGAAQFAAVDLVAHGGARLVAKGKGAGLPAPSSHICGVTLGSPDLSSGGLTG